MLLCEITNLLESEFKKLQATKVPLTPDEHKTCMAAKAVWHHGPGGSETPAVWKSVHPKTKKITYVTHTHRAYNTAKTLASAINKYHSFIKGTS